MHLKCINATDMMENFDDNKNRCIAIIRFKDKQYSFKHTEKTVNKNKNSNKIWNE